MLTAISALAALAVAPSPDNPPVVAPPRFAEAIRVDGALDEPVWRRAAVLRGFDQYLPADGRPAEDSTVVLVWYSETAIHFGVRAFQDSASVRATLADRDRIEGDDQVLFLLDTFNDRREALLFAVNPLGQQADGTVQDAARRVATLTSAASSGAYAADYSPDFVFESRGRVTPTGYEIEIRIPFKSLRFQNSTTQDWGLNIIRRVQSRGHEDTWAPVLHSDASFLGRSGTLTGLTGLRRGVVLDVTPEVTSTSTGVQRPAGWTYVGGRPEAGATARWGLNSNLTLNGTANPDFSQVESDVPQLVFDPRDALFYPEKRPFFLDGLERFSTPVYLIYTRRLIDPVAAVKLTGKLGGTSAAFLAGWDDRTASRSGTDTPFMGALRLRWDVGARSALGVTYTDHRDGTTYNRVAAVDGRLVWGPSSLVFQAGASATRATGDTRYGPFWLLQFNRAGRRFALTAVLRGLDDDFRAESGFLNRIGTVHASLQPSWTHQRRPGSMLETVSASILFDGLWDYDRFTAGKAPNDPKLHFNFGFAFRGGWQLGVSFLFESFAYPQGLYAGYAIDNGCALPVSSPPDTLPPCALPFTGVPHIRNTDIWINLATPRFQNFSADLSFVGGRDENFFEWAPAIIYVGTLDLTWRPSDQLRVNLLYNHQQYVRPGDRSTVGLRRVPRLKVEYQLTRVLFVRVVGQYDADRADALRDDSRTGLPLIARDPVTGAWQRVGATSSNALSTSWLFSYRPTPGTVLFAGYGNLLTDTGAFRFRGLDRASDGFFVKASYLFRV